MKLKSGQYLGHNKKTLFFTEKLAVTETYYYSLQRLPQHEHERNNLVIVKSGTIIESFSGIKHYLSKGDIIIHPRNKIHSDSFRANSSVINIEIDNGWAESKGIFKDTLRVRQYQGNGYLSNTTYKLLNCFDGKKPVKYLYVESLLVDIFSKIIGSVKAEIKTGNSPGWLEKVVNILHDEDLTIDSIEQIASQVDLHPVYLSRAFKLYTGSTIMEYLINNRLNRACRDLAFSDLSITQIGLQANFYDQAHFIKTFKKCLGITPYKYRKLVRS